MPEFAIALIEGLEQKGRCYATLLQLIATRSMSKRLAHLLLTLANIKGKTDITREIQEYFKKNGYDFKVDEEEDDDDW